MASLGGNLSSIVPVSGACAILRLTLLLSCIILAIVPDRGVVCAGMVLLVFCNGMLDAWLVLSKRSPIAIEKQA